MPGMNGTRHSRSRALQMGALPRARRQLRQMWHLRTKRNSRPTPAASTGNAGFVVLDRKHPVCVKFRNDIDIQIARP